VLEGRGGTCWRSEVGQGLAVLSGGGRRRGCGSHVRRPVVTHSSETCISLKHRIFDEESPFPRSAIR